VQLLPILPTSSGLRKNGIRRAITPQRKRSNQMITPEEYQRKSRIAGGISLIALLFLLETYSVDQKLPNPATPFIWAGLIAVALIAAILGIWIRSRAEKG
jgi:hypothetical protein